MTSANTNVSSYKERQERIDRELTPNVVCSILGERASEIVPRMRREPAMRHVTIVYASTDALLRRINGGNDAPINIGFNTLEEERKRQPESKALAQCDGAKCFCVTIATHLPLSLIGMGGDSIMTQGMTCLLLPF